MTISVNKAAEALQKTTLLAGVTAKQAAKAADWMAKNAPPLTEWDTILIQNNPSLSRRCKKKMIKEIRRAIEERERMVTNENTQN